MTVAVTGASGHVGANLVRALMNQGRRVRALVHRDTRALQGLDVETFRGDVADPGSLRPFVEGAETVFHLAAVITLAKDKQGVAERTNADGTRNVADVSLAAGVNRLIHFSSIHTLSPYPRHEPVTEARELAKGRALPMYDRTKVDAEMIVLESVARGLDAVIVNPTAVVGPNDFKPSTMGSVLLDLYHGRIPALVRAGYNWVDVRDVCTGALEAERRGRTGERYLLGGRYLSFLELATLVEQAGGKPAPRIAVPLWLAYAGLPFAALGAAASGKNARLTRASLRALAHRQEISHEKAARELNYVSRPIEATIQDTIAWFGQAGFLTS